MKKILLVFATLLMSAGISFAQNEESAADIYNQGVSAYQNGELDQALEAFQKAYALVLESGEDAEILANCKNYIPNVTYSLLVKKYNASAYEECLIAAPELVALAEEFENAEIVEKGTNLWKDATYYFAKELEDTDLERAKVLLHQLEELGDADRAKGRLAHIACKEATEAQKEANAQQDPAAKKAAFQKVYDFAQEALSYEESANAYKLLGAGARGTEKWAEALESYQKYLELKPDAKDLANITNNIASCYEKLGDKTHALEAYKKVAEIGNDKQKESAKKKIEKLSK